MTSQITLATAGHRGGRAVVDREPLGPRYLQDVAEAAQEFTTARRELIALRAAPLGDDQALQGALARFERARRSVKAAIRF